MPTIVEEFARTLSQLDPARAEYLEDLVRDAMRLAETNSVQSWPEGYFEQTSGAFANEPFERSSQGELPQRDTW